jgi:hypothetical protein
MLIRDGKWKDALFDIGPGGSFLQELLSGRWATDVGRHSRRCRPDPDAGAQQAPNNWEVLFRIARLYNVTSYFGDVLSYSRLMALMLAGTAIASVVNMLGALPGSIIIFIPIFLLGHAY